MYFDHRVLIQPRSWGRLTQEAITLASGFCHVSTRPCTRQPYYDGYETRPPDHVLPHSTPTPSTLGDSESIHGELFNAITNLTYHPYRLSLAAFEAVDIQLINQLLHAWFIDFCLTFVVFADGWAVSSSAGFIGDDRREEKRKSMDR